MKAVLIWKNCDLFEKEQDGFWIQCPSSELDEKILPHLSGMHRTQFFDGGEERYLSTEWATINPGLLVEPDSYYFIVSRDGKEIQPTDPFFPYSSQWYGGCPLEEIDIMNIDSINDLAACPRRTVIKKRIVLISCVSQKLSRRAKARDLYVSTLFKFNLKYAEKLKPDNIFVLSAKHGLLSLEKEIEPYEQTLNKMSVSEIKQWASRVLEQIKRVCSINETEFVFLAGDKYRKYLLPHVKNSQVPLEGLRIGEQLQKLKGLVS